MTTIDHAPLRKYNASTRFKVLFICLKALKLTVLTLNLKKARFEEINDNKKLKHRTVLSSIILNMNIVNNYDFFKQLQCLLLKKNVCLDKKVIVTTFLK